MHQLAHLMEMDRFVMPNNVRPGSERTHVDTPGVFITKYLPSTLAPMSKETSPIYLLPKPIIYINILVT